MTHTYVILEVSPAAYDEIAKKLQDANYQHVFHKEGIDLSGKPRVVIDMHGIALKRVDKKKLKIVKKKRN